MNILNQFLSFMNSGGPIMWVIFVVACITLSLLTWEAFRGLILMQNAQADYQKMRTSGTFAAPTTENITSSTSPISQLLAAALCSKVHSKKELVKEFNIHLAEVTKKIEGSLATIATLGSLLPMLGLLGTVTGMINVFEVIAIHGSGKPDAMADGISQALLTTASGLIIAIPVIFFHHLLASRVSSLMIITHQSIELILHQDVNLLNREYNYA